MSAFMQLDHGTRVETPTGHKITMSDVFVVRGGNPTNLYADALRLVGQAIDFETYRVLATDQKCRITPGSIVIEARHMGTEPELLYLSFEVEYYRPE